MAFGLLTVSEDDTVSGIHTDTCWGSAFQRTLVLQVLLLEELLLLGRAKMLQSVGIRVRTRRHATHQGWVHVCAGIAAGHGVTRKLLGHVAARRALLSGVGRHSGAHGMSGNARMTHASRMAREVGPHTGSHVVVVCRSATHGGRSRRAYGGLSHAHASRERKKGKSREKTESRRLATI